MYECTDVDAREGRGGLGYEQVFKGSLMKIATEEKDQLRYFADIVRVDGVCLYGKMVNVCRWNTLSL